jgi:hypothetical protein
MPKKAISDIEDKIRRSYLKKNKAGRKFTYFNPYIPAYIFLKKRIKNKTKSFDTRAWFLTETTRYVIVKGVYNFKYPKRKRLIYGKTAKINFHLMFPKNSMDPRNNVTLKFINKSEHKKNLIRFNDIRLTIEGILYEEIRLANSEI